MSLKGQMVYMRWAKYGWQLGKIYPASLTADNYASGPNAALDSWVILKKKTNME